MYVHRHKRNVKEEVMLRYLFSMNLLIKVCLLKIDGGNNIDSILMHQHYKIRGKFPSKVSLVFLKLLSRIYCTVVTLRKNSKLT